MILVIDNYDSFVHNLARYVRLEGACTRILRHDAASVDEILAMQPDGIVLSPGPKAPAQAGICLDLIQRLPPAMPLLGVCLGHQCLVEACGGKTVRAKQPMHGRASSIRHDGEALFSDIVSPTVVGRYHSLIGVESNSDELIVSAYSEEGEIMAVRHRSRPWFGVQFHPESLLTSAGPAMIANFVRVCRDA